MSKVIGLSPGPQARSERLARNVSEMGIDRLGKILLISAICLIFAGAIAFRLWDLMRIGFNSDEAVYTGQAAALAGDPMLDRYFSVFRAHPLLMQSLLAIMFAFTGVSDAVARFAVAIVFGVGSIAISFLAIRRMFGAAIATIAAGVLAAVPYHVILSRQVLLDAAVTIPLVAYFWALFSFSQGRQLNRFFLSAPLLGIAILTKETAIIAAISGAVFLAWSGAWRPLRLRHVVIWTALVAATVSPFLVSRLAFAGEASGGYVLYQFLRPPNHDWWYFPVVLWEFVTPWVLIPAVIGLGAMIARRTAADMLVLAWGGAFGLFFQAWPTKLFFYLMPVMPVIAVCAGHGLLLCGRVIAKLAGVRWEAATASVASIVVLAGLAAPSVDAITAGVEAWQGPFRADVEVQDFAGAREVGRWMASNSPDGAVLLTIGPSLGNIMSFYGHREWFALSIPKDPAARNPAYRHLANPDLAIRRHQVHYAVWDAYSADRSAFYNARLMRYVRKYMGTIRYSAWIDADGQIQTGDRPPNGVEPRVVVYDLVGGNPLEGAL